MASKAAALRAADDLVFGNAAGLADAEFRITHATGEWKLTQELKLREAADRPPRRPIPGWAEHQSEHVLVYGRAAHGFHPTCKAALVEGYQRFGRVPFPVKQVDLHEKPRPWEQVV